MIMESDSYELMARRNDENTRAQELRALGVTAKKLRLRVMDIIVLVNSLGCYATTLTILRV